MIVNIITLLAIWLLMVAVFMLVLWAAIVAQR